MKDRRQLGVKVRLKAHQLSQKCRRKIEEISGRAKTMGCFRKSRYLGVELLARRGAVCRRRLQSRAHGPAVARTT